MRWSLVVALLILWSSPAFAQTATVTHNVNLRNAPSTDHPPIRLLKLTEPPLTLIDLNPQAGFYHVRTSANEDGWVWGLNVLVTTRPPPAGGGSIERAGDWIDALLLEA